MMDGELILVVEDNEKNRKLVRDVLEHKGYRLLEAVTAEEGIELAKAHRPALVLMDIHLPGIDGVEAFRRLRRDADTAAIPVIAVTASAMQEEQAQIKSEGFDGYQPKPIRIKAFVQAVEAALAGRRDGA